MIEGVLRHCTSMEVEKNYVDSHGQSEVAFAFTHLLGFQLMPRLKRIKTQKLYRPYTGQSDAYPNLQPILTRPINWDLIRQQYDQMVKYATALRLGTAETEAILKRFSKNPIIHPTYLALLELGRVIKTIFLCQYLEDEAVRREVNEGLNVVERWNGVNDFIFYGKGGEYEEKISLPKGIPARTKYAQTIGSDGMQLLKALWETPSVTYLRQIPTVEILRLTWIHQYYVENDQIRLRAATDLPPTGTRIDSFQIGHFRPIVVQ